LTDPDSGAARTRRITLAAAAVVIGGAVAIALLRPGAPPLAPSDPTAAAGAGEPAQPPPDAAAERPEAGPSAAPTCQTTLVFDNRDAAEAFGPLLRSFPGIDRDVTVVVCVGADEGDCGELARRFAASFEKPPDRFFLLASSSSQAGGISSATLCSALYGPDGSEIERVSPQ